MHWVDYIYESHILLARVCAFGKVGEWGRGVRCVGGA